MPREPPTLQKPSPPQTRTLPLVERMYRVFRDLELNPLCIVSGGAGRLLVDQLSMPRRYIENLVLDGLAHIALAGRVATR